MSKIHTSPNSLWVPTPQHAVPAEKLGKVADGIAKDIPLIPIETILATTEEFIGSRVECTTMAKTKSTIARLGLDCFGSAGWGDIGYINRWAFPLHNRTDRIILLRPGTWIAQIIFLTVTDRELSYILKAANYQWTDDFQKLIREWSPLSVLPKPLTVTHLSD
jgi:deoxycytidine triphosphate deaminase